TIFFGGGTPSLLEPHEVARLITVCRDTFSVTPDAEVTLETNPETVTVEKLAGFLAAGVNRVSFGVQSFDDAELARLGRIHSARRAEDAVRDARTAGLRNVSFDLMFWLPGQSLDSWQRTVDRAIALAPDHLSLYLLELYPNAPLRESMARIAGAPAEAGREAWAQAPDDEAADMYLAALEALDAAGFDQYEISNVARPGFWSRHNVKYWQSGDWRGFGCGAHSTVDGVRWKNVAATPAYIENLRTGRDVGIERERLSDQARRQEALFTGLRMTTGIDRGNFSRRFGVDPWAEYGGELAPAVDDGLMWRHETRFGLTRRGMLVANEILATFV
ncbi:MAG TPA: radical SAM family heme chaperone HemW, partial [Vicinamibacterales bacterium]|nr:radical SAM family heme chaperone HemW [Vicinamibacterales bacterium]